MNHPLEPGNLSRLGTFKDAYFDDDSTGIGSDDLGAQLRPPYRGQPRPQDGDAIA